MLAILVDGGAPRMIQSALFWVTARDKDTSLRKTPVGRVVVQKNAYVQEGGGPSSCDAYL